MTGCTHFQIQKISYNSRQIDVATYTDYTIHVLLWLIVILVTAVSYFSCGMCLDIPDLSLTQFSIQRRKQC